ncbi:H+- or Na+-translocating F-type, V-type and A-type ATPase (F-ATPase) Superfamily [Pseudoloma neurophilia]|uniref:H+-or Na+-translocating F-type, V-type and A-type ATPase (F-ATPase) Superfamily n=1 Tax=Pseudoloma neurophilia TaxID=146866 RepID=A0A0R0LU14_9MICR|nr:H+- or Na+-translocating F-type, V-type and A-type ATPase (F-ATPase) Superfamily [Pseudoloma neurophilia]
MAGSSIKSLELLEENKVLITGIGIGLLTALSSYASCSSILGASIHAIPLCKKKNVLTNSYIAVIMASTIFVYSLILAIIIINKMDVSLDPILSLEYFSSSLIFGVGAYFCSKAFGQICKKSYTVLEKNQNYYITFICALSVAELVTLFSFLIALFIVLK